MTYGTAYFIYGGSTSQTVNVSLIPKWSNEGLTFEQCGIARDDYCFVYDEDGSITLTVPYYYCNLSSKTETSADNGRAYQLVEVTGGMDSKLNIYAPLMWKDNKFITVSQKSLNEILGNWDTYRSYSLSAEYYNRLDETFAVINGKLYTKSLIFNMQIKENNGYKYVVKQVVRNYSNDGINYYNYNKYVYNYNMNGVEAKLYTRYKYEENVFKEDTVDEKGEITSINGLKQLMPTENKQTCLMDIVFAEGVRVSLFAGDATIYKSYNLNTGEKITTNSKSGIIKCLLP